MCSEPHFTKELGGDFPGVDVASPVASCETRRSVLTTAIAGGGVVATAGFGGFLSLFDGPAFAQANDDIQVLQTAASLENLAVGTYEVALSLPFIGGESANPVIKAFVQETKDQHVEHAKAFNSAVTRLGGKAQTSPNPVLLEVVNRERGKLTDAGALFNVALLLERAVTETYVANTSSLVDLNARRVTASIMGVEAQHIAVLNALQALIAARAPHLIAVPPDVAALPATVGSAGFPQAFSPSQARPASEGAIR